MTETHVTRGRRMAPCMIQRIRELARRRAGLLICLLLVAGCADPATHPDNDVPRVRLQLNWLPDAQFGGYYAALLRGDYEAEGLEVEILPGGPGINVIPKVALGRAEFGVGNADQVLLARQQEGQLVAVMATMQHSPRCIMVHASRGIGSLRDLSDATLAIEEGRAFAQFLKRAAALTNVRMVSYSGSIARFLLQEDFAQQAYVFSEPVMARREGADVQVLPLSELGFDPYSGIVMTNEKYLARHPDIVRRFVRATCRGWQHYLAEPMATNHELQRLRPEVQLDSLHEAIPILTELCASKPGQPFGVMVPERWITLASQLRELGLLALTDEEVRRAFALEFVTAERQATAEAPAGMDRDLPVTAVHSPEDGASDAP